MPAPHLNLQQVSTAMEHLEAVLAATPEHVAQAPTKVVWPPAMLKQKPVSLFFILYFISGNNMLLF